MDDRDFLSFLVDETLKLQSNGEVQLSSLELKLNDYGINFLKGEFIPQSQVLRFIAPFGKVDIPVNWSIFCANSVHADYTLLDQKNDQDHFFSVIKTAWNISIDQLLITHADGFCYLVGLKPGENVHLRDLVNPQEWLKSAA